MRPEKRRAKVTEQETELSGYLGLGMINEALKIAKRFLSAPEPSVAEFKEAMDAILVSDHPKRWRKSVEAAYSRLSAAGQRAVRFKMLSFNISLDDFQRAAEFLPPRNCRIPVELAFGMDVMLALDRLKEAKAFAIRCRSVLDTCEDELDRGLLLEALACFAARTGNRSAAVEFWCSMPMNSPLLRNALTGIVEASVVDALLAARAGLSVIAERKRNPDMSIEVSMPGLEKSIAESIEKDLLSLQRKLERILPPETRKAFGLDASETGSK